MTHIWWTAGRVRLAVTPGERRVVAVHELGGQRQERERWLGQVQGSMGAWVYAQRGHAPSGWATGHVYRVSDFAIDLVRLLRDTVAEPCLLVGQGTGGLVAVLAAAAAPGLVAAVHLVAAEGSNGWGADPAGVVSQEEVLNRAWLDAAASAATRTIAPGNRVRRQELNHPGTAPGGRTGAAGPAFAPELHEERAALPQGPRDGDDPFLAYGPAEKIHQPAVRAAAAAVRAPWSVEGPHFLEPCLPAQMRAERPVLNFRSPLAPVAGHEALW